MLNHKVKSTIAKLSILVCLGLQVIPSAESAPLAGSVRLTLGDKPLDNKVWSSMEDQNESGVIFNLQEKEWHCSK